MSNQEIATAGRRTAGIALCLSGGGYRAALFHLGTVRRLNELGILSQVATVSSVSGGSILAAHLAETIRPWPDPGAILPFWDERVAKPFKLLTGRNIRTAPFLKRALPWNWGGGRSAVDSLADAYERHLTSLRLPELPERPAFIFCSTDMSYGVNWIFSKARVGDWQLGYLTLEEWLDYAARPDGAGASVSRVLGVEDLERLGPEIANVMLELANASAPLFEYCFLGQVRMGTAAGAQGDDAVAPTVAFDAASLDALASSAPYHLELDSGVYRSAVAAVLSGKHLILTGPPGTAKTTLAELTCQLARAAGYCTGYMLTTATADWTTYETIGGLRPTSGGRLEFRQGHFLEAATAGRWLIIDELNRSNFDRAFGQLFTVLSGQSVVLPYEDPGTDKRIVLQLEDGSSQYDTEGHMVLMVPASWRIIATMNVFDKSLLFAMSFALMRRFAFVEVAAPAPEKYMLLWGRELDDISPDTRAIIDAALTGLLGLRSIKEIGPAVFLDMARFAREYLQRGAEIGQRELTFQLFYSYLLPQFEGVDNRTGRILYRKVRTLVGEDQNERLRRILSDVLGLVLPAAIPDPEDDPEQADMVGASSDEEAPGLS